MIDIFEIDIIFCFSYEVKVPCTVDVQQSICARSLCFVANFASRFFDLSKKKQPSNLDGCLNKYLNFYLQSLLYSAISAFALNALNSAFSFFTREDNSLLFERYCDIFLA
jgi:hypothetical protein